MLTPSVLPPRIAQHNLTPRGDHTLTVSIDTLSHEGIQLFESAYNHCPVPVPYSPCQPPITFLTQLHTRSHSSFLSPSHSLVNAVRCCGFASSSFISLASLGSL